MSKNNSTSASLSSSSLPLVAISSQSSSSSAQASPSAATIPTSPTSSLPLTTSSSNPPVPTPAPSAGPPAITVLTQIQTISGVPKTVVVTITAPNSIGPTGTADGSASAPTPTSGSLINNNNDISSNEGLGSGGKIAVSVVVPIAAVALLILVGIYLWRKYKQKRDAEEQRRKEVEEYGYNPNADPTIPAVAAAGGPYEANEDTSFGYRGWGTTTLAGSSRRKPSTTMSGGAAGPAYSDDPSPTRANQSDTLSTEHPTHDGSYSPEGEILGAMGPSAADNRGGNVHRGPSNASSSYNSATGHSDGSGDGPIGVAYAGEPDTYNQYGNVHPYADGRQVSPEVGGQPVIRDVAARRNTRIENPAHFPQQSAGISQNF